MILMINVVVVFNRNVLVMMMMVFMCRLYVIRLIVYMAMRNQFYRKRKRIVEE